VPGHVFAIDSERLRYGYFTPEEGQLMFREYHSEPLGRELFHQGPLGGPIRDPDNFRKALEALIARISQRVDSGSLVVPDHWLRVSFAELDEAPRGADPEEVARFKLKRLVPFRVEDLRLAKTEVPALHDGSRGQRLLLGFGVEALFEQLESGFERHDIKIGHISNEGLSLLSALKPALRGSDAVAVVYATSAAHTVMVARRGEPILHRFKQVGGGRSNREYLVPKDLRLTRTFVGEQLNGHKIAQLILVAPAEEEMHWRGWLETAFELPVRPLTEDWPELPGSVTGVPIHESTPLLGAALREVG
jgi:hypothetical protein